METEFKCLWCEEIVQNRLELHVHTQNHYKEAIIEVNQKSAAVLRTFT